MKTTLDLVKAIKAALTDPTHPEHDLIHKILKKATKKLHSKRSQVSQGSFRIEAIQKAQIRAEELIALAKNGVIRRFAKLDPVDGLTVLAVMAMTDEAARRSAMSALGSSNSKKSRRKYEGPRAFVISEWKKHRVDYNNNKSAFAEIYSKRVMNEFPVKISARTIREDWLKETLS